MKKSSTYKLTILSRVKVEDFFQILLPSDNMKLYVTVLRPRFTGMKCIERSINLYSHDNAGASEQSHSMTLHTKN